MHTNVAWTGLFEQNMHNLCVIYHWTWVCGNNDDMMLEFSHSIHYCVIISVLLHPKAARRQWENKHTKKSDFDNLYLWQPSQLQQTPNRKKKKSFLFMYVLNTHERLGTPCNYFFQHSMCWNLLLEGLLVFMRNGSPS